MSDYLLKVFFTLNDVSSKLEEALKLFDHLLKDDYPLDAELLNIGANIANARGKSYIILKGMEEFKVAGPITSEIMSGRKKENNEMNRIVDKLNERIKNHNMHNEVITLGRGN